MTKKQIKALKEKMIAENKGATLNVPKLVIAQNKVRTSWCQKLVSYNSDCCEPQKQLESSAPGFNHF